MSIDINQPVKPGSDLIINTDDGEQRLGTADELEKEIKAGNANSSPPNDNPRGDPNSDAYKKSEKPTVSN